MPRLNWGKVAFMVTDLLNLVTFSPSHQLCKPEQSEQDMGYQCFQNMKCRSAFNEFFHLVHSPQKKWVFLSQNAVKPTIRVKPLLLSNGILPLTHAHSLAEFPSSNDRYNSDIHTAAKVYETHNCQDMNFCSVEAWHSQFNRWTSRNKLLQIWSMSMCRCFLGILIFCMPCSGKKCHQLQHEKQSERGKPEMNAVNSRFVFNEIKHEDRFFNRRVH